MILAFKYNKLNFMNDTTFELFLEHCAFKNCLFLIQRIDEDLNHIKKIMMRKEELPELSGFTMVMREKYSQHFLAK